MTDLVNFSENQKPSQLSLAEIQSRLDARQIETPEGRPVVASTKKAMAEKAKADFESNPIVVLDEIRHLASALFNVFDPKITVETVPLTANQVVRLSGEFYKLEQLKTKIAAIEPRYRELIFAHLNKTLPKVPGRPAAQVPGKVEAEDPEPHYVFERRGGNRGNPDLDVKSLCEELPDDLVAQIFSTVHHEPVAAWDEEVFDEARFGYLVESGAIPLDLVAKHLKPGAWRTPTFYTTLVEGTGSGS